jgi:hypothetical protein
MRYYLDTEFIEDGKTIDLISIGIVAEDGREFYGQSVEWDANKASDWVVHNVFPFLQICSNGNKAHHAYYRGHCLGHESCPWYKHSQLAERIKRFCDPEKYGMPELWGYYSAYDHVAFCQLFGTMMDLPKGYPMYTRDLKQWFDVLSVISNPQLPEQEQGEHHALADARHNRVMYEYLASFSKYV